jgi:hypothetical protein
MWIFVWKRSEQNSNLCISDLELKLEFFLVGKKKVNHYANESRTGAGIGLHARSYPLRKYTYVCVYVCVCVISRVKIKCLHLKFNIHHLAVLCIHAHTHMHIHAYIHTLRSCAADARVLVTRPLKSWRDYKYDIMYL